MKLWIAYKMRGTDFDQVKKDLRELLKLIEAKGHETRIMIRDIQDWDPDSMPMDQLVHRAHEEMEQCDACLCIYPTDEPSEGRGWEGGYFRGCGKPTIMAIHKSITNGYNEALYCKNPACADCPVTPVIRYETFQDIADAF